MFLKSLSPSFLYTDFTENTEKGRFLRDSPVKLRITRVVRVQKGFKKQSLMLLKPFTIHTDQALEAGYDALFAGLLDIDLHSSKGQVTGFIEDQTK